MGGKRDKKKKKDKDLEKKAERQLRQQQKADKAARKRLHKESGGTTSGDLEGGGGGESTAEGGPQSIDALLSLYAAKDANVTTAVVEVLPCALHDEEVGDLKKRQEEAQVVKGQDASSSSSSPLSKNVQACTCFPSPRANFSLTLIPSSNDMILFGGEYYNGAENVVYDDLYRWDPDAKLPRHENTQDDNDDDNKDNETKIPAAPPGVWKHILTPTPRPPARCAHSAVWYNQSLYIFGGELATTDQFYHYKDLWKFHPKTNTWEQLTPVTTPTNPGPSPRSGHRAIVWRHYMIVFGGFYEALRETKFFNDLHIYDFQTNAWTSHSYSKLATVPPPRSACAFALHPNSDVAYMYGGFAKIKNPGSTAEGKVFADAWVLHLRDILKNQHQQPPKWERVGRAGSTSGGGAGEAPRPPRSSAAHAVHKSKLLFYGGVRDDEGEGHRMSSVFYDELFSFEMERRRWYKLHVKPKKKNKKKKGGRRRNKLLKGGDASSFRVSDMADDEQDDNDEDDDEDDDDKEEQESDADAPSPSEEETATGPTEESSGWDLDMLKSNMFAFIDGDGNIVYEKIEPDEEEEEKKEDHHKDKESKGKRGVEEEKDKDDEEDSEEDDEEEEGYQADGGEKISDRDGYEEDDDDDDDDEDNNNFHGNPTKKQPPPPTTTTTTTTTTNTNSNSNPNSNPPPQKQTLANLPTTLHHRTKPLPRINPSLVVRGHDLYIMGGLLEVGDREVTLDDVWKLNLHEKEAWECLHRGSMHCQVWKGVDSENDADSYVSVELEGNNNSASVGAGAAGMTGEDGGLDLEEEEEEAEEEDSSDGDDEGEHPGKKKKKKKKKLSRKGIRAEMEELRGQLQLDEEHRTPQLGEVMADFYARTSTYWSQQAVESLSKRNEGETETLKSMEPYSEKELKRIGFGLAKERFEELRPVLERLNELEQQQQVAEKEREMKKKDKEKDKDKKKKKKKDKKDSEDGGGGRRRHR